MTQHPGTVYPVAVITPDIGHMAVSMVEAGTEYDYIDLPEELQGALLLWCEALFAWRVSGNGVRP